MSCNELFTRDMDDEWAMAFILTGIQILVNFRLKEVCKLRGEAIPTPGRREQLTGDGLFFVGTASLGDRVSRKACHGVGIGVCLFVCCCWLSSCSPVA